MPDRLQIVDPEGIIRASGPNEEALPSNFTFCRVNSECVENLLKIEKSLTARVKGAYVGTDYFTHHFGDRLPDSLHVSLSSGMAMAVETFKLDPLSVDYQAEVTTSIRRALKWALTEMDRGQYKSAWIVAVNFFVEKYKDASRVPVDEDRLLAVSS